MGIFERAHADLDGPNELRWVEQVRSEQANSTTARAWALETSRSEPALRLTAALAPVWAQMTGIGPHQDELKEALALDWDPASNAATAARASVLNSAGFAAMSAADLPAARRHFEEASILYQRLGDQILYARAEQLRMGHQPWR